MSTADHLDYADIEDAARRIDGHIRPITLAPADTTPDAAGSLWLALEFMQHTGTFKARGAANFLAAHLEDHTLSEVGVTIASGGNAGLACAWAARRHDITATVFVPANAPAVKVARLLAYGARVEQIGDSYADAAEACAKFAADTGALQSHAYDNPLIAAGAGTLMREIHAQLPSVDTVLVAVGGGGLYAGIATAAAHHGVRVIAVEPENCRALHAALEAGQPVAVPVDSIAADSLGARIVTPLALTAAAASDTRSLLVSDADIIDARARLWDHRRLAVEHGGATALAALTSGAYVPAPDETACVVLCGANTSLADLDTSSR
ncbi:threonine/serine dehydratase [Nocardia macrotermitis]|uniref:Phenylserine dehydratase n=1 Tax=Nocardia macrotermitis TaxID=2585198 RepID=A0A7K0DAW3_9NOCA|nr:threonine/serine dehydratase [Nocardia macrotermitis]MQY22014.1 Phenylserine dehydratase [Nocardia macrotermitis]